MNLRRFFVQLVLLAALALGSLWLFIPSASADAGPPPDPTFREEAPERQVECDNNVFVPMGEGGTWDCPPTGEQLPEERIGRAVDCPDGSVGYIIDVEGNVDCQSPQVIPPGTIPGPDQVEPGGSMPFYDQNGINDWLFHFVDWLSRLFRWAP